MANAAPPAIMDAAEGSSAQHQQQQHKCQGLLVFRRLQQEHGLPQQYESMCLGRNTCLGEGQGIDLWRYTQTERPGISLSGDDEFEALVCLGSSVYQHATAAVPGDASGSPDTQVPPPFCHGVELLQYAAAAQHAQHKPHQPAVFHDHPAAAATATAHHSMSAQTAGDSAPFSTAAGSSAAPSSATPSSRQLEEDLPALQPPPLLVRMQQISQEIAQRLEGQDPWWFAKAFARRAELNAAAMAEFGRQLWAQAAGHAPADDDHDMDH